MKQEICPHCGAAENVIGKQSGYSAVTPDRLLAAGRSQTLYHVICQKCGTVIRSYVENPQTLKVKNER